MKFLVLLPTIFSGFQLTAVVHSIRQPLLYFAILQLDPMYLNWLYTSKSSLELEGKSQQVALSNHLYLAWGHWQ